MQRQSKSAKCSVSSLRFYMNRARDARYLLLGLAGWMIAVVFFAVRVYTAYVALCYLGGMLVSALGSACMVVRSGGLTNKNGDMKVAVLYPFGGLLLLFAGIAIGSGVVPMPFNDQETETLAAGAAAIGLAIVLGSRCGETWAPYRRVEELAVHAWSTPIFLGRWRRALRLGMSVAQTWLLTVFWLAAMVLIAAGAWLYEKLTTMRWDAALVAAGFVVVPAIVCTTEALVEGLSNKPDTLDRLTRLGLVILAVSFFGFTRVNSFAALVLVNGAMGLGAGICIGVNLGRSAASGWLESKTQKKSWKTGVVIPLPPRHNGPSEDRTPNGRRP